MKYELSLSADGVPLVKVFTGPAGEGFYPVLVALESSDLTEDFAVTGNRIADALERIAAALEGNDKPETGHMKVKLGV